jgi:hypothetical protein
VAVLVKTNRRVTLAARPSLVKPYERHVDEIEAMGGKATANTESVPDYQAAEAMIQSATARIEPGVIQRNPGCRTFGAKELGEYRSIRPFGSENGRKNQRPLYFGIRSDTDFLIPLTDFFESSPIFFFNL